MEYIDPVIVKNNSYSAYIIDDDNVVLNITPELKYVEISYPTIEPHWCVRIVYDAVEDLFMFSDEGQRNRMRNLLKDMRHPLSDYTA